jgi:hypothetical protein
MFLPVTREGHFYRRGQRALLVYDVTTAPGGKVRYKDILQHFEERRYLHPVFSNRLEPARWPVFSAVARDA